MSARFAGPPVYRVLAADDGRVLVVSGGTRGVAIVERDGAAGFRAITMGGELPAGATETLGAGHDLGGAWLGSDGVLRVLAGEWLFEATGDRIARAVHTGATCDPLTVLFEECHFVPTDDRSGDAVVYLAAGGRGGFAVRHLECSPDVCTWTPVEEHGLGSPGPLSGTWEERIAFRDGRGTLFVVHRLFGSGPGPNVRVAGGGRAHRLQEFAFRVGAAPRSGGGVVVVTHRYDHILAIHVLDEDPSDATAFTRTSFDLGMHALEGSTRIGVIVTAPAGEPERAHVVLSRSESELVHLAIDLATGDTERIDFGL